MSPSKENFEDRYIRWQRLVENLCIEITTEKNSKGLHICTDVSGIVHAFTDAVNQIRLSNEIS